MWARVSIIVAMLLLTLPALAQLPPPTAQPTLIVPTVPVQEINNTFTGAADQLNELPTDITKPSGQSILPTSDPTILFGYVKWLFNYSTAAELLGARLAPLGMSFYSLIIIAFTFTTLYMVLNALVLTIRFVIWIISLIMRLIELIPVFE